MEKHDDNYEYENGFKPKEVKLKENYKFYNRSFFFVLGCEIVQFFNHIIYFLYSLFYLGVKTKGKKNLKGNRRGSIFISNHVLNLDAFYIVLRTSFCKLYVTMLQSNLGFKLFSKYIRLCGAVPIPVERKMMRRFNEETKEILKKGKNVLIYPEAKLYPYCDHIRPFESGAFHYANKFEAKLMPIVITFHKPKGWYKLVRRNKPVPRINYLPAYTMPICEKNSDAIKQAQTELHKIMSDFFIANSDYYYNNGEQMK